MTRSFANLISTRLSLGVAFLAFLFIWITPASAQNGSIETFNTGNKLYEQQKFSAAADEYQKLIQSSNVSSAVYYNLGNAAFKAGHVGRAIAAYRNARALAPRDPDIQANLQFARNQANSKVSESLWQQWIHRFSLNEWAITSAVVLWLFFGLLILGQWRPALKQSMRLWSMILGLAVLFLGLCLACATYDHLYKRSAVVSVPEAVVRRGPFEESQSYFTLRDGSELSVIDKKEKWLQVADRSNRIGWLPESQVVVLNDGR